MLKVFVNNPENYVPLEAVIKEAGSRSFKLLSLLTRKKDFVALERILLGKFGATKLPIDDQRVFYIVGEVRITITTVNYYV